MLFLAKKKDFQFTVNFIFGTSHGLKIQIMLSEADAQVSRVYSKLYSLCLITTANLTKNHQPRHLLEMVRRLTELFWSCMLKSHGLGPGTVFPVGLFQSCPSCKAEDHWFGD